MNLTYENGRIVISSRKSKNFNIVTVKSIANDNRFNEILLKLPQNDTGNAKRFLLFCRNVVKFNVEFQDWMFWNGKYWSSENVKAQIYVLAQAVMEKYYNVAKESKELDEKTRNTLLTHARQSNNAGSLSNMISLLKHMNYVNKMYCKKHYLNVQNGVVNLKTKELLPHNPNLGCTNICNFKYNPNAKSTRFKNFVKEITDGNEEIHRYLKTAAGYWITGTNNEQKFFVLKGNGSNGKSKFLEVIAYVLGNYATTFPINAITKSHSYAGQPTPELVPLTNRRFTYTSELKSDDIINDAVIKQLTGGEKVLVRQMRKEYSEIDAMFKIVLDTNYEPNFKSFDFAIKRRLVIIPFTKTFDNAVKDTDLSDKLRADGEYILKWLINGAYMYYNDGLDAPIEIRTAIDEYCHTFDSIGSFIDNMTEKSEGFYIRTSELYSAYTEYCRTSGLDTVGIKQFSQGLSVRNLKKKYKNDGTYFCNIKLK